MLDAITLIKCYLWGDHYRKKVSKIRKEEVCLIYKIYLLLIAKYTISESILNAACYIFIISSISFGKQVKVETIFFLLSILEPLTHSFKILIPRGMHEKR
ncbi:hypothetical protein MTP99_009494 [Tenebrio molitor]|nr:hypothetical protein MTP99_009494 [Tenebrio molitor]